MGPLFRSRARELRRPQVFPYVIMLRMAKLLVKQTSDDDIDALAKLQAEVYPRMESWQRDQFLKQLEVFPEGQLVAKLGGRVVGCASSLVILWDEWADEYSWSQITAAGTFKTHNTSGMTLYGAEVFVDPRLRDGFRYCGVISRHSGHRPSLAKP